MTERSGMSDKGRGLRIQRRLADQRPPQGGVLHLRRSAEWYLFSRGLEATGQTLYCDKHAGEVLGAQGQT